jgi:PIN domain nuclease of toxin-antitoxin system
VSSPTAVLDASALLAFLFDEVGADRVEPVIAAGVISTANWAEVCQRLEDHGASPSDERDRLGEAGLTWEPVTAEDAERAAALRPATRDAGLSLADRCCLALAERLDCAALTADVAWGSLDVPAKIELIR